jgi:hypothetical protein
LGEMTAGKRTGSAFDIVPMQMPVVDSILAVDPGPVHCGMAWFVAEKGWHVTETADVVPIECLRSTRDWIAEPGPGVLVVEGFQLYPNMLQEQGLSRMGTPEVIGALKWLYLSADNPEVSFYEQGASIKRHGCMYMNQVAGGHCEYGYRGGSRVWIHDTEAHAGTNPHKRDAEAHGWYRVKVLAGA